MLDTNKFTDSYVIEEQTKEGWHVSHIFRTAYEAVEYVTTLEDAVHYKIRRGRTYMLPRD